MAQEKQKLGKPPPKCTAILLCDQVIIDAVTGKKSLIGVFDSFRLAEFPGVTRTFTTYLELVDGIGAYSLEVEVHDLRVSADGEEIDRQRFDAVRKGEQPDV